MIKTLLVISCAILAQPPESSNSELANEVAKLIRNLNADALTQREAAEQRLLELGPKILELLPDPNAPQPAETEIRLDRVTQELRRQQIDSLTQATHVTLENATLGVKEVFRQIEEQTGNQVIDYREEFGQPSDDIQVQVDFDKETFWEALDDVLDQAGLTIYTYGGEPGLAIVASNSAISRESLADYQGAFRFEPVEVRAQRNFNETGTSNLRLKLAVGWEPRLSPIVMRHQLSTVRAIDGDGEPLVVEDGRGNAELEFSINKQMHVQEFEIPFKAPPRETKEIQSVSGGIDFLLTGPLESFHFDPLTDELNIEQTRGQATVVLERVRKNRDTWEFRVLVQYTDSAGALQSHYGWIYNNPAMLVDANGEEILPATIETTRRTESEIGMAYMFDVPQGLEGMTFVYKTPVAMMSHHVDYELQDLKLP